MGGSNGRIILSGDKFLPIHNNNIVAFTHMTLLCTHIENMRVAWESKANNNNIILSILSIILLLLASLPGHSCFQCM